jgi:hypothetical protein
MALSADSALLHGGLLLAGICLMVWGLPASQRLQRPWDTLAALAVLIGVILGLLGALLLTVPNFFKG